MEHVEATAAESASGQTSAAVGIEIEADPTLGYASIQNSVPVLRSIRLSNHGPEALEGLEVLVACDPGFAQGARLRFDRLAPGEVRRISPVDLRPDHAYLAQLQESIKASLTVTVVGGSAELGASARPIEVLAYDQWAGTRALPELLAAFCMPNNPAVDVLIGKASKLLRAKGSELSMNGYQSKSRDLVWKQVSAIYSTLSAEGLQYAEPPASFGADGQKIRTPDRILEARVATCLDLAMLFASCLEQAGLRPVVLIKEGHAWVGVWLHPVCFADPLTDDVQTVRKRVETGEFLAFETTGVSQHHSHRPSLRIALEQGQALLQEEGSFRYAVDIHRAREVQIKPLPSRGVPLKGTTLGPDEDVADIEPTPHLPPLDPTVLTPLDLPGDDTPEGRLAKWKFKLLDLTLRNRLLNFKPTKATMQFVVPDSARLEDALAEGADFRVRALPAIMEGSDPRVAQVHANRGGRTAIDDMALEALGKKELLARVPQDALDGNLLAIHAAARTSLEEGGANTLFLAIGMLRWTEDERSDAVHLAPILLVPVTLQRQSVRSGFKLSRHDDEALVNPTLLQLLKKNFELKVAGLEAIPADERGIDVAKVLQAFRRAVREIPKWEVRDEVHLGIFSFTKHLMWRDLQDRTEQLKTNRVVKHLIEHPGEAFAQEQKGELSERLDDTHQPQDILAPLLSDSSQLKAICALDAGHDLVLEGPPGTGKSQTITNLIAHTLAKGKTVLFVSEKMAALEVVHRRLNEIGLGPFCLELHSAKARKSEVLQQLGKALDLGAQRTADDWGREAQRLAQLRLELNGLVDSLHRVHRNGLTVFEAIGICIEHNGAEPAPMPWTDPLVHGREELDGLRESVRRMATLAGGLTTVHGHPLSLVGQTDWSPTWQDEMLGAAQSLDESITAMKSAVTGIAAALGLAADGMSLAAYAAIDSLADLLLGAPKVPVGLARSAHDEQARARVRTLAQHGSQRAAHWARLGSGWSDQLATLNSSELRAGWAASQASWWPLSMLGKRKIKVTLSSFRLDGRRPEDSAVESMLGPLADVNAEDRLLRSMHDEAQTLLDDSYAGVRTDWASLEAHEQWARRFADVVTLVAGRCGTQADALRAALQPLVAQDRALLSPSAPVGRALLEYRDAWRVMRRELGELEALAKPLAPLQGPEGSDGALERLQGVAADWQRVRRQIQPWCLWRGARDQAVALGLQGVVSALESGTVELSAVERHFEFSYRSWWVKRTIDNDPILRSFSSADHERKIREFRQADERFQQLSAKYIVATLAGRVPSAAGTVVGADSELGRLRREMQRQRGHMPVRQLVQGLPTLLPKLKPCLLMSPLSVAQYLDAGHAHFDLVVFDEASQIPVWDAVGAIARGRQLAVVGDTKQLPPTNFFHKSTDGEDGVDLEGEVEDLESILDECLGAGMNRLSLQWHYRSKHESLITFSNANYYESSLVTFPSPVTDDVAVRFERVAGVYDRGGSRTNNIEAQAVVKAIEDHYLSPSNVGRSLGVVTFNQPQQALIETLLDARRRASQDLDRAIAASTAEPLFIKNLENVQGDERDVIFFSIAYGPDVTGKTTMNFGPLNSEGGQRRLNVVVTRAREGVVVYSSLMPEQIDLAKVRAAGVRDLKHYLEFALRGPRALAERSMPTGMEPESPFEKAVIKVLRDRNWVVHPQVGCSSYRIDIGVVDPRAPGRYLLGIECDGRTYHSGATARDRDRLRQHMLERLGWRFHRIWSTDWWLNPDAEIEKILARLQSLLEAEEPAGEVCPPVPPVEVSGDEPGTQASDTGLDAGRVHRPAETAAPPPPQSQPALPTYAPAILTVGRPDRFYAPGANRELTEQLRLVIEAEGPILDAVLFRRVARAWGLERTGSRIVERLQGLVPGDVVRSAEKSVSFYWPSGVDRRAWRGFRVADSDEASRRHVDDICLEELGNLALHVLMVGGSTSPADLARSVCRLVGMARTTADAEARVGQAVEMLRRANLVTEVAGAFRRSEG